MIKRKKQKAAGRRYQQVETQRRRKELIAKGKEEGGSLALSQERLLCTPFWPDFDPERDGMKVQRIEWLDDDEDKRVSVYPSDEMLENLFALGMAGNMMGVFLLVLRESDDTGYVKRRNVFFELQRIRQISLVAASRLLKNMLINLQMAGLVVFASHTIYVNPAYAYKGDRGKAARTIRQNKL